MKKLLRTAAAAACLCLLAACAPARQAGGGEPGAPREDFTSVPSGMQAGGEPEAMAAPVAYRAMWVSYLEWPMFDTSGAQGFAASVGSLLDNCAALGLNTVIVQVRPFGDAVYPSAVYPWSHLVTGVQGQDPGYDPLAIFVEQAHARGLAIEAWVNPYRVRLNDTMPRRAGGGQPGASARGLGAGGERRAVLRPRSARGAGHGGAGRNGDRAEL